MADVKSRLLLSSNRVAEDDSELRGVVQAVVEFDAGLFVAYCAAWNERILNLSQAIKSEEFTKAYNTLVAARSAILKARGQYEKALHQYSATFEQHREATQQTEQLKDRLREVALTELFEEVVFVQ